MGPLLIITNYWKIFCFSRTAIKFSTKANDKTQLVIDRIEWFQFSNGKVNFYYLKPAIEPILQNYFIYAR